MLAYAIVINPFLIRGLVGFICLGLPAERFALEWVQEHIACFGGDPTKVTM